MSRQMIRGGCKLWLKRKKVEFDCWMDYKIHVHMYDEFANLNKPRKKNGTTDLIYYVAS